MPRFEGRRPLACHHEAGHALIRWYFGHRTDRAVVLSVAEVRAGLKIENRRGVLIKCEGLVDGYDIRGYPYGPKGMDFDPDYRDETLRLWSVSRDIELIHCLAGFYAEAAYRRISASACMFDGGLNDMRHFRTVLDAWELSPKEHASTCQLAEGRTAALIRSPMGKAALKAIADVLHVQGEADGDQIAGLCRLAYGDRECAFGAWTDLWPPTLAQLRQGHIPDPPPRARAA